MLKDETFFDSVLFLPWGRIAIKSSAFLDADFLAKIKPQPTADIELEQLSQLPKFLNMICFILKLLKGGDLEDR
jgi:hypothetical protein